MKRTIWLLPLILIRLSAISQEMTAEDYYVSAFNSMNHSNPLTGHKVESFEDEVVRLIREGKIETSVKY